MTTERARDVLNAASLGRGTGHVYTEAEAEVLLTLARSLARAVHRSGAADVPAAHVERTGLQLVVLGRAA